MMKMLMKHLLRAFFSFEVIKEKTVSVVYSSVEKVQFFNPLEDPMPLARDCSFGQMPFFKPQVGGGKLELF